MRFVADDGAFGFRITPEGPARFFVFQLAFGNELVGDMSPCIAGSCFGPLASVRPITDPRISADVSEAEVDVLLSTIDSLNEASLKHLAESLDDYTTRLYLAGDYVKVRATQAGGRASLTTGASHYASVARPEFAAIVAAMRSFWESVGG